MTAFTLPAIARLITQKTGICFREQDYANLTRKLEQRSQALGLQSVDQYCQFLSDGTVARSGGMSWWTRAMPSQADEWQSLVDLITVRESYFFRDRNQMKLLETTLIPTILQRRPRPTVGKPCLRLWSAGCSTGEEPYSLAILLLELLDLSQWDVLILGTDICETSLAQARAGRFSSWSFRQFDPALREKYFQPHPQGWQIDPRVQQLVKFQHNNLLGDPFPVAGTNLSSMDVILCRNVFIYFSAGAVDQVLDKFVQTLNPDGFLMTGHAELQGHRLSQLRPRSFPESVVYQRSDLPLSAISPASLGSSWNRSTAVPPASATPASAAASLNPSSAAGPSSPLAAPAQFPSATSLVSPPAPGTRPPAPPTTRTPVQSVPTAARGAGGVGTTRVGVTGLSAGGSSAGGARAGGAAADAGSGSPPPLQDAKARKQRQDYEGMVTGLQAFLINPPVDRSQHLEALVLLAQAQANLGQIQEAQQTCQDALKLDPCSVEIYTLLAQVAEETGDLEGAKVFLKRVIYLDPEAVMAYFNLGLIYEQENSVERARKVQTTTWDLVKRLPPETIVDLEHQRTARDLQAFLEQKL